MPLSLDHTVARFLSGYGTEPKKPILVVGDVMLDQCFYGDISREPLAHQTHGLSVMYEAHDGAFQGGGAAYFVASLAEHFDVHLVGVTGKDAIGDFLYGIMSRRGCHFHRIIDPNRPTTLKVRFFQWHPGMKRFVEGAFRLDHESRAPISADVESRVHQALETLPRNIGAVFIHDFGKGLVTPTIVQRLTAMFPSVPLFVDPKFDARAYSGVFITALLPNEQEANLWAGNHLEQPGTAALDPVQLSEVLMDKHPNVRCFVVKLGERGCLLLDRGPDLQPTARAYRVPAHEINSVHSTWGAGDVFDCYFCAAFLHGLSSPTAAMVANVAAGIHVSSRENQLPGPMLVLSAISSARQSEELGEIVSASERAFHSTLNSLGGKILLSEACAIVSGLVSPVGSRYHKVVSEVLAHIQADGELLLLNAPSGWGKSMFVDAVLKSTGRTCAVFNTPVILSDGAAWNTAMQSANSADVLVFDEFDKDPQASRFLVFLNNRVLDGDPAVDLHKKSFLAITSVSTDQFDRTFPDLRARFTKQWTPQGVEGDYLYIAYAIAFQVRQALPKLSGIDAPALRDLLVYSYINNADGRFNNRELAVVAKEIVASMRMTDAQLITREHLPATVHTSVPCAKRVIPII